MIRFPRAYFRHFVVVGCALTFGAACDLGFMRVSTVDPDGNRTPVKSSTDPDDPTLTPTQPGTPEDPEVSDPNAPPPELHQATVGTRCVDGAQVEYLVLSTTRSGCEEHALAIDSVFTTGEAEDAVVLELSEAAGTQTVRYCETAGDCRDIDLDLVLETGGATRGTWTGAPTGTTKSVEFTASECDYDAVVDPLPGDTLAAGISVDEVSVYQGVKIPIFSDGTPIVERNAPVIAGRPGVVRVFLSPQPEWVQREVIVRLTVGDLVKEQTLTPMAASSETATDSTANFDFAASELPPNVEYSVEVIEAQSCSGPSGGDAAGARVPDSDTLALDSRSLGTMRITLVPIQYDADGSGRLPDTSQGVVDSFRDAAFARYPVEDLEITVRDAVPTAQGIGPNGAGFGQLLNLCLNTRAQDNPDPDVFYYCVVQPAATRQAFCGGGCVAGVAPLNLDNRVDQRAGMGIGFNGGGQDTFVHETAHALGRPHSPCGGAAQTDPNFPYAQGGIGSWGYDITSGQLIQPNSHKDFMSYCSPNWVSDYTYTRIYNRLDAILGTQMFLSEASPVTWRTAVFHDGDFEWGDNRMLRAKPSGHVLDATLRDEAGLVVGQAEVYMTEVADLDAVLFTIEAGIDTSYSIEIPGFGTYLSAN